MSEATTHYRTCPLCEAMCGLAITVRDGAIQTIRGDAEDPFSRGHICPKGAALQDIHADPDRLRHPMRRGPNGWERIEWEEAFAAAAWGGSERPAVTRRLGAWLANGIIWSFALMVVARLSVIAVRIAAAIVSAGRASGRRRRAESGRCAGCGYDLRGSTFGERCPECGVLL